MRSCKLGRGAIPFVGFDMMAVVLGCTEFRDPRMILDRTDVRRVPLVDAASAAGFLGDPRAEPRQWAFLSGRGINPTVPCC